MADEPTTPAAPANSTAVADPPPSQVATPQTDPTPAQVESKGVVKGLSDEISDLWAQVEGKAPRRAPEPPPEREAPEPVTDPEPVATDAPKAETPPPAFDQAEIERQAEDRVRQRLNAEAEATRQAETRLRADQQYRQAVEAYIGPQADYDAVNAALRAAIAGDHSALNNLDVVLPNGQSVSQVSGSKGLTEAEAANLLNAWDTARGFENVMGDRKVQRIVDLWNSSVMSVLTDPDVDTNAVTQHADPANQMKAAIETTRAAVTRRLTDAHADVVKAKDAEIERLTQRVTSLTNERPNLVSQERARSAASPDRPGPGPGAPRDIPRTAEEIRRMSPDEFFKSGMNERLLQAIPGGASPRRRAG